MYHVTVSSDRRMTNQISINTTLTNCKGNDSNKLGTSNGSKRSSCPYLDTINRRMLDFDFEKSCSISLMSGPHIYGCLVCGKFFHGRGKQTPACKHFEDVLLLLFYCLYCIIIYRMKSLHCITF